MMDKHSDLLSEPFQAASTLESTGLKDADQKKATVKTVAFFLCLLFSLQGYGEVCRWESGARGVENVTLQKVIDGDTVWLKDGRKVRLLSINAPEIAHEDKPGEPLGEISRRALEGLLKGQSSLLFLPAPQGQDRYGRHLGRLFLKDGSSVESLLLSQGMAFQVFFEGVTPYQACLSEQESQARKKRLGVWGQSPVLSSASPGLSAGFSIIRGKVQKVSRSRSGDFVWVELSGEVVLKLSGAIVKSSQGWRNSLVNREIEVRGWMVDRMNPQEAGTKKMRLKKGYKRWMLLVHQKESIEPTH